MTAALTRLKSPTKARGRRRKGSPSPVKEGDFSKQKTWDNQAAVEEGEEEAEGEEEMGAGVGCGIENNFYIVCVYRYVHTRAQMLRPQRRRYAKESWACQHTTTQTHEMKTRPRIWIQTRQSAHPRAAPSNSSSLGGLLL